MSHQDHPSTEVVADHAEDLLSESGAGLVGAHLEECAGCRINALLLALLREILAADDPGPMPARHAARIEVTLAELAITEPVLSAELVAARQAAAPVAGTARGGGGAAVLDLASRRAVMIGAVRRLGTVAAGVVLVMGGAALAVATIGSHGRSDQHGAIGAKPPTIMFAAFPTAPPGSTDGPNGTKEGPNHWIYTKDKVFLPGGEVVLRPETPGAPPVVISPVHKPAAVSPPGASKATRPPSTVTTAQAPATGTGSTAPAAAPTVAATPPPTAPAANQPTPTLSPAQAAPGGGPVHIAARDPYVSRSGTAYTEDNFAAKVMDLMLEAAADHRATNSGGAQSSSTDTAVRTNPQDDPAAPPVGPQSDATTPPGGSSAAEVKARVLRCAAEIPGRAIAGDEGTWLDRPATIVVVPSDHADQVVGYVFYGDCTKRGPATASDYEWKQQVNNPTAEPARSSTSSARRVDDSTGSGQSQRNTVPAGGAAPAPSRSPASAAATPGPPSS